MSLAASDVNSPFSILLSLCFSGSCRFTGCDRRCMNNHLFMVCLTLTHGSVWSAHTWNEAEWMGFLHPLEKVKFKIMLWSSRPSGETSSTCKMCYIVENNLYLKNKYLKPSGLFHSASPLFTSQNRTQLLLHAAEKGWSSPLTRHWETLYLHTRIFPSPGLCNAKSMENVLKRVPLQWLVSRFRGSSSALNRETLMNPDALLESHCFTGLVKWSWQTTTTVSET